MATISSTTIVFTECFQDEYVNVTLQNLVEILDILVKVSKIKVTSLVYFNLKLKQEILQMSNSTEDTRKEELKMTLRLVRAVGLLFLFFALAAVSFIITYSIMKLAPWVSISVYIR